MEFQSKASGEVLPPGTLPKIALPETDLSVKILSVDPENGYTEAGDPVPSENDMVKVQYPDGFIKSHQVSNIADLLARVKNTLMGKYTITSFEFGEVPEMKSGTEIKLVEVTHS